MPFGSETDRGAAYAGVAGGVGGAVGAGIVGSAVHAGLLAGLFAAVAVLGHEWGKRRTGG
ncbi:hypothetical protein [Halostella salina]|uniref:hypothetical protein n=1 Tax=Halostella salina TaxID=1547897 RepID=UPI000EF78C6F|nr:hypothetical protein [Halostella salina]